MSDKKPRTAITPTREDDFPEWFQQVIKAADMAENSPVRGCMTIKPYGYALWENIVGIFDPQLKEYGIQNCSFPLLIPVSFLAKEAEHVDGFAKECAVVTHHRLKADGKGGLEPASPLEEPYVVRPTSETIIGEAMSRWIQSYRDLPMKLNQWGSVLRWEMRTRMFLRTSEFFWHEGHCAFEDNAGAVKDCLTILDMYERFFEDYLAFSGYKGIKTADERFPGADDTYAFEAMMQDGKALQAATTHNLGTNFAKSCGIKYQSKSGEETLAHTTSWAFSSRVIGAILMIHADDDGAIMPPRVAPQQIVILPVLKDDAVTPKIMEYCDTLAKDLKAQGYRVKLDDRDMRTPDKMWDAVKRGIPLRVEVGQREMEEGTVTHVRRDIGRDSKTAAPLAEFKSGVGAILDAIHDNLLEKSRSFTRDNTVEGKSVGDIDAHFKSGKIGFVKVPLEVLDDPAYEKVRSEYGLSSRVKPFEDEGRTVLVARAY